MLPHQRMLNSMEKQEVHMLLSLKANKKMVKEKMTSLTGKKVLLKDLSNIQTKMKSAASRNDLNASVKQLTEKHGEDISL